MKLGANHPMGPLELADFIGLDTCLSIMQVLYEGLSDSKYRPCPLLVKYVEAGWLGRKTGRGFYDYTQDAAAPDAVAAGPERRGGDPDREGRLSARIGERMEFSGRRTAGGRGAIAFIFVTVMLDMLALAMVIPVLPKLIGRLHGRRHRRARPRSSALFGTAWALMQFVFSPVLGALSDRFGRRPVILISMFGLGLDYMLMALAPALGLAVRRPHHLRHHRGQHLTAFAYIADVTPPREARRAPSAWWAWRSASAS